MEKASILIVEDEAIINLEIQSDLEALGYEVAGVAFNGEEALETAQTCHPTLALMDINLRGKIDGIETARQIRKLLQIPIIFLSGAVDNETVQRSKSVEPYGYIVKPFSQDDLRITLEHAISKARLESAVKESQQALQISEQRLRNLIVHSPVGIVFVDNEGCVVEWNQAVSQITGISANEAIGQFVWDIQYRLVISENKSTDRYTAMKEMIEAGLKSNNANWFENKVIQEVETTNCERKTIEWVSYPIRDNTGISFIGMLRDITKEMTAEQIRIRQYGFSQKLAKLTELLNGELELPKILRIICSEIEMALNIDAVQVSLYDPERDAFSTAHSQGPIDIGEILRTPHTAASNSFSVARDNAHLVIADAQADLITHPAHSFLVAHDIRSIVITNLVRETQLIGKIGLATIGRIRLFDDDEVTFVVTLANNAAIAIDRARMYHQTKRRTEELEMLGRLSAVLRQANSRQEMMPALLQEAVSLTQADAGVIYLFGQTETAISSFQISAIPGLDPNWFTPSGELWVRAISCDELFIEPLQEKTLNQQDDVEQPTPSIRDKVLIPFHSNNTLAAIMVLGFHKNCLFDKEDLRVLASLAEMGGNALHRSGLMEMLEQRVSDRTRELSALYDLTVFVNSPLGLNEVLKEALQKIVDVFHASIGLIFRYDPDNSCLNLETQVAFPVRLIPAAKTIQLNDELLLWLETSRSPWLVYMEDSKSLPFFLPSDDSYETLINIPVRFEGMTLGLLSVIWLEEYSPTVESIAFLSTVSERLGSAIQNALLRQKSERAAVLEERQRLARELHDSVTQSLYSLTLLAEAGKDLLSNQNFTRLEKCLADLSNNSIQALKEMRMLLFELRPPQFKQTDLAKALDDRLESVERRAGVQTSLAVDIEFQLPDGYQDELYWVACEALNNALKHSGASAVDVKLVSKKGSIKMEVADNGRGFSLDRKRPGGIGLSTMQERVEHMGGKFEIKTAPDVGTLVSVIIDLPVE